jgi:hypothetical protein
MLTTVVYGLLCGVAFIPVVAALSQFLPWPAPFRFTIWLYLAGYLVLLTRWKRVTLSSILLPLLLLLCIALWGESTAVFGLLSLGILSWVRSGNCFQEGVLKTFSAEAALCLGGAALVVSFSPLSMTTWAVGVWMFFLVQSLYFLVFSDISTTEKGKSERDSFEQTKIKAEKILSTELQ